jgi:hypothetical protein
VTCGRIDGNKQDAATDLGHDWLRALREHDPAGGRFCPSPGASCAASSIRFKPGSGRPPIGLERMLRIHFLQQCQSVRSWVEEALYESLSMRRFVGLDLGREPVPDETTVCKFRRLLERHDLGRRLFRTGASEPLELRGLKVATGATVDATSMRRVRPRTRRSHATPSRTAGRRTASALAYAYPRIPWRRA